MNETVERLCRDVNKLRKRINRLTIFSIIAGLYISSLTIKTKELAAKQNTEGV